MRIELLGTKKELGLIASLMSAIMFTGCASLVTNNLDSSHPVDIKDGLFEFPLQQNGNTVDYFDALKRFSEIPEAQRAVSASRSYFWASVALAGAGGGFLGASLAGQENKGRNAGIGIGFIGISTFLEHFQRSSLRDAANIYNKKFALGVSAFEYTPYITANIDGGIAGIAISF